MNTELHFFEQSGMQWSEKRVQCFWALVNCLEETAESPTASITPTEIASTTPLAATARFGPAS